MNTDDWQSWAAPAVVILTAAVMIWRMVKTRKAGGCGGGCACAQKPKMK